MATRATFNTIKIFSSINYKCSQVPGLHNTVRAPTVPEAVAEGVVDVAERAESRAVAGEAAQHARLGAGAQRVAAGGARLAVVPRVLV